MSSCSFSFRIELGCSKTGGRGSSCDLLQSYYAVLGEKKPYINLVLVFNATISNISAISWRRTILSKWYIVFLMNTIDILFTSHVNNNQEILFWNKSENSLMIGCVSVVLYQMRSMFFVCEMIGYVGIT